MRTHIRKRSFFVITCLGLLALPACGSGQKPNADAPDITTNTTPRFPDAKEKDKPQTDLLKDEIPPKELDAVISAHLEGLGHMERYEYRLAVEAFRQAHERAPGWIAGSINLAIALLNDTGTKAEEAKKKGGGSDPDKFKTNFDEALSLLDSVIARAPENLNARYCRGLILEFLGGENTGKAHEDFVFVTKHDDSDGHAWYKVGSTLTAADNPTFPAGPPQAAELIKIYEEALKRNPNLVPAYYKLSSAYAWSGKRDRQAELMRHFLRIDPAKNPAGPGDTVEAFYGETGKYAKVINPFRQESLDAQPPAPPKFEPPAPVKVKLAEGEHWAKAEELTGTLALFARARARFGATVVSFDANGDGKNDLFLAASIRTATGLRDALLLNRGDGSFEDVSKAWGLPGDRASLGAAAGDFDADRRVDLFLCGPAGYLLLKNAGKAFEDVTEKAGIKKSKSLGLTARWLDLDQDGDLDLYVLNCTDLDHAADAFGDRPLPGVTNAAFRNDGKAAKTGGTPEPNWAPLAVSTPEQPAKEGLSLNLSEWPDGKDLLGPPANYSGMAAIDADDDRDLDLVLVADGKPMYVALNDRLGKFHGEILAEPVFADPASGLLVLDLDKDGRADLVAPSAKGRMLALRNATNPDSYPRKIAWETWPVDARTWRTAEAADLDLDTWTDVVGLPATGEAPVLSWGRNDGKRLVNQPLPLGPESSSAKSLAGFVCADVAGDPLPDAVLLPDGEEPRVARNLGNGNHWLALDLVGQWKNSFDHMRTNPHGLGTRITVEGQGLLTTYQNTTPSSGLGQSLTPFVLGLGKSPAAELVRLKWPDGTMQCELNQKSDVRLSLTETNRKTGSCPVLFTWNGSRFVCLGDFLGGGGMGYLVAPGVYGQPDRDESVAIAPDQLRAVRGVYRLSITEPMDEVAYLDRLDLQVVDRPPGVSSTPDERFAPEGPRPTGEVIAWSNSITPLKATDLKGRDITATLAAWDRDTADGFERLSGWIGYAEEHGIVLDFGDRLSKFGPQDRLVLALAGWVEYPYSQTNYAASTAGVALKPPVIERRNADESWTVIEPHAGYPAGLPRLTTLDLTGTLTGPSCVIRLKTNMECYWDQAFIAVRDAAAEKALRVTTLPVARAALGHRGYSREVSPDGRQPLLYDYEYSDPAPLALMAGRLTRFGEVRELLTDDDDRLCLVGPGDEVRLEFGASALPALQEGWTRSFVLKAVGYCKDADPFTAGSDRVEPLPWKAMPSYPFETSVQPPDTPAYREYLREYQTRPAGGR